MSHRVSDCPPVLGPGEHALGIEQVEELCVKRFPLSRTRARIMASLKTIAQDLVRLRIPCHLIIDGSFVTEEIEPSDVDFAVAVTSEFYENCSPEQRKFLDWIGNDKSIVETHLCDCYLCVEYKPGQVEYFDGMCDRAWWIRLYSESVVYKRKRGVAIVNISEERHESASASPGQN